MTRAALLVAVVGTSLSAGCIPRLSDPFFGLRELGAPDERAGESLVVGTIELEAGLLGPGRVEAVILKRLRPEQEEIQRVASERLPFRALRTRQVKDGHFVLALEPGAYELHRIVTGSLFGSDLVLDEDGRRATRFTVSRPGVIDLGLLRVAPAEGLAAYSLDRQPSSDPARTGLLRAAVAGTKWEHLPTRGAYR